MTCKSQTAFKASSDVSRPRIISTSLIKTAGLKKCMPTNLSGLSVAAAMAVIEIEEVLEAKSVWWPQILSNSFQTSFETGFGVLDDFCTDVLYPNVKT